MILVGLLMFKTISLINGPSIHGSGLGGEDCADKTPEGTVQTH